MRMFRNLNAEEIEVRIGQKFKNGKVSLLLYQDSRCAANILDETVGQGNWSNNYVRQGNTLCCSIGIYIKEHNAFVYKADAGTESNFEAVKGEYSDAFKRAAAKWGIGRELYSAPKIIVPCDNEYEQFSVDEISYDNKDRITDLTISDSRGNVVFKYVEGQQVRINTEPALPPEEILKAVCGELKADADTKELLKFYNYYVERIKNFNNVNAGTIKKLWSKWTSN